MTEITEREAIARCRSGGDDASHTAFRLIYEAYAPEVFRFLRRILGDRQVAEDTVQETFLRLHKGLKGYDLERPLRPYVLQVARNAAIDLLRTRHRRSRPEALEEEPASPPLEVVEAATRAETKLVLEAALAALAPEHRAILVLRYMNGLKLEDIADAAACTVRTTRNRLRAAAVLLERELKRRGVVSLEVLS
jgi:RNA polymerase sigma-70 factor (ECF subfamily)